MTALFIYFVCSDAMRDLVVSPAMGVSTLEPGVVWMRELLRRSWRQPMRVDWWVSSWFRINQLTQEEASVKRMGAKPAAPEIFTRIFIEQKRALHINSTCNPPLFVETAWRID